MTPHSPLVVIVGPTASGKSALAMQVAKQCNGEIICADSRTIYKGMDIGTAKPTRTDQRAVKHHLLDIVEPSESFSVAQFKQLADAAILDITSRGKLPILVGGTGLYIDAVIFDYQFGRPAKKTERLALEKLSVAELQTMCRNKNINMPTNKTNRRHLVRAIEIGGLLKQEKELKANTVVVGLTINKARFRSRIEHRIKNMLEQGVVEETKALVQNYGWHHEAMSANIYRAIKDYIEGSSQEALIQEVTTADMKLAKRQMTWFKRNSHIMWNESAKDLITKIDQFVRQQR